MAGFRSKAPQRLSPDAERLVADALALDASGSRIEDVYWEQRLSERLSRLLKNGSQTARLSNNPLKTILFVEPLV